jgi:deoxyribose-phosphate aldolase
MTYTYPQIAKMVDHSLLNPVITDAELEAGCRVALDYDVASVCIKPYYLKRCSEILAGSTVVPSTVIGFPHGGNATAVKRAEAEQALKDGGAELDMVVNIGKVLSGDWDYVREDLKAVIDLAHAAGAKVKVIFENCYLNDEQKIHLCQVCGELRADWVKTSTGFGTGGGHRRRPEADAGPFARPCASQGGWRCPARSTACWRFAPLGVTRCGATATVVILDECKKRLRG